MNEVIILEGADGSGKSSLAKMLVDNHGFRYEHSGVPNPKWTSNDLFRHYVGTLYKAQLRKQPVVFDRHYLGEFIYGPVCRGSSLLSPEQRILIERLVRAGGTRVVVCAPPLMTVVHNWIQKKEDYVGSAKQLDHIHRRYEEQLQLHPDLLEKYDYTNGAKFERKPLVALPQNVIGSVRPRMLLIGERVNDKLTSSDLAFFACNGSSHFLNQALAIAGIPEKDLAFMNARSPNKKVKNLKQLVEFINPHTVVALGKVAEQDCHAQGVECQAVPHPQHTKRFGGAAGLTYYAKMLGDIYHV